MTRISRVITRLQKEIDQLKVEKYENDKWLNNAEKHLASFGYVRCNIPACNCNSYHRQIPEPEV